VRGSKRPGASLPQEPLSCRPEEAGGSGRGFGEEELLCLAVAASLSNGLIRTARAQHLELTRAVVRVRGGFPDAAAPGGVAAGAHRHIVDHGSSTTREPDPPHLLGGMRDAG
jgi:hypothetical protein